MGKVRDRRSPPMLASMTWICRLLRGEPATATHSVADELANNAKERAFGPGCLSFRHLIHGTLNEIRICAEMITSPCFRRGVGSLSSLLGMQGKSQLVEKNQTELETD